MKLIYKERVTKQRDGNHENNSGMVDFFLGGGGGGIFL